MAPTFSIVMPAAGTRWLAGRASVCVKFPRALARNVHSLGAKRQGLSRVFVPLYCILCLGVKQRLVEARSIVPMTRAISHFHFLRCLHYLALLLLLPWTFIVRLRSTPPFLFLPCPTRLYSSTSQYTAKQHPLGETKDGRRSGSNCNCASALRSGSAAEPKAPTLSPPGTGL